ncbi:MAG: arginine repressor [Lachnospiraceae bacterium]|nr:arginine repressor [Lachnospiraceae bacterium]
MAKKPYAGNEKNIRSVRFKAIKRMIADENIGTQQQLLARLKEEGYDVTQGTISRDIRDLKLVKVSAAGGGYKYEEAQSHSETVVSSQFHGLIRNSVTRIDSALNQVVIRTYNGMASAVCAALDTLEWKGLLGTVAGDDTIIAVLKTEEQAKEMASALREI